ncbi:MAG: ABC transporter permease [Gammaproteobacteria bacterium]|nr:ABC transporter permease [Gammaproteobacteria bacterium]MDH5801174.1 ABC transporter permease [Gammaproteobacteria bacterium]
MNLRRFNAVFIARNLEFYRDRSALAWNILFPVLLVFGFAFAFSNKSMDVYKVGLMGESATIAKPHFLEAKYIQFIPVSDQETALHKVARHQLDMLLNTDTRQYWINPESPKGYVLERMFHGTELLARNKDTAYKKGEISGKQVRYIDWLVPGILGMNIMFSALFGIGYVIVRYRKNGVLKRLSATPLTALEFLSAQIASRLALITVITMGVYAGVDFFLDFSMAGSYGTLFLLFLLGTASMVAMGLIVAARVSNEELAGGILNMISWPMMFLSGVWFSLENLDPVVKQLAQVFPLTHMIDGVRAVMIDGKTLPQLIPEIATLSIMTLVFLLIGAVAFRWK